MEGYYSLANCEKAGKSWELSTAKKNLTSVKKHSQQPPLRKGRRARQG